MRSRATGNIEIAVAASAGQLLAASSQAKQVRSQAGREWSMGSTESVGSGAQMNGGANWQLSNGELSRAVRQRRMECRVWQVRIPALETMHAVPIQS
jgi:hypothetical protein